MRKINLLHKQNKKNIKVNIIPLIDIIFLMLVFFMLATNFSNNKLINFSIDGKSSDDKSNKKTLKLIISSSGDYKINDEIYKKKDIEKQVLKVWGSNEFSNIFVLNDKNAIVQDFIFIVEILKKNKINKVNFSNLND